jgi:hypothetical protein
VPFAVMPLHPGPNAFQDDDRGLADPVASFLTSVPAVRKPQASKQMVVACAREVNRGPITYCCRYFATIMRAS